VKTIDKGQRLKLSDLFAGSRFEASLAAAGPGLTLDFACFCLDAAGKLSDENYMTFFNQPTSPCGGVAFTAASGGAKFAFDLDRLPASIDRLVLTAALDGAGAMGELSAGSVGITQGGQEVCKFSFSGADFSAERALMLAEFYRKDGAWRVSATGQGFNGGLDALVQHFGGDVADPAAAPAHMAAPAVAAGSIDLTKRLDLEKRIAKEAPQLVSLTKSANISLEKVGLGTHKARFCAVFDISYSMDHLYSQGEVQAFAERALAMGCRFDDDGEMDIFLFGARVHKVMSMNIGNYKVHLRTVLQQYGLEGGTDYGLAIQAVRNFYFPENGGREEPKATRADTPVYVAFLTDGDTSRRDFTERQVRASSYEPIFWQFVGIGNASFPFLQKLDDLKGRLLDNAGFFAVEKPTKFSDDALFTAMVGEYAKWVVQAKQQGLLS
jgi:stress response protein SCP2